jgi:hypothetical protein
LTNFLHLDLGPTEAIAVDPTLGAHIGQFALDLVQPIKSPFGPLWDIGIGHDTYSL